MSDYGLTKDICNSSIVSFENNFLECTGRALVLLTATTQLPITPTATGGPTLADNGEGGAHQNSLSCIPPPRLSCTALSLHAFALITCQFLLLTNNKFFTLQTS